MPSIQSKAINVLLRLMRMKRTVNRMRQRVESGDRTYSEPSKRLHRKHLITKRAIDGHLVWTIAPKQNATDKAQAPVCVGDRVVACERNGGESSCILSGAQFGVECAARVVCWIDCEYVGSWFRPHAGGS
jgi:hypothetical protein